MKPPIGTDNEYRLRLDEVTKQIDERLRVVKADIDRERNRAVEVGSTAERERDAKVRALQATCRDLEMRRREMWSDAYVDDGPNHEDALRNSDLREYAAKTGRLKVYGDSMSDTPLLRGCCS